MSKHKLAILGLSLAVVFTACKKNDALTALPSSTEKVANASNLSSVSDWKTVSNWNSSKKDNFTIYTTSLQDSSITSAIVNSGLVLVFKKGSSAINSLPFQEKGTNDIYWFYQISANTIQITANNFSTSQTLNGGQQFTYFIVSSDKLKSLESQGHSKIDLMQLSYENATALLKK